MEQGKEPDLRKSRISDDLVHKIREESLKIEFGKIILNIAPGKMNVEYTRFEREPVSR
jgi:hypothetical protein